MLTILASLSFLGLPLIVVAVLSVITAIALQVVQKRVEGQSDEDDPDDDPAVRRVSAFRKVALIGGGVLLVLGAVLLSAPAWSTIL